MNRYSNLISEIKEGKFNAVARALTLVENDLNGSEELLRSIKVDTNIPVIGITGPPGAGKSTLVNAVIDKLACHGQRIAVIAVDPTSPFNLGSLLGDRIRMSGHFNNPNIYIRSVAARGSVGGLSSRIIEMTDILKASNFNYIFVETVGVGQSEIEIAGLADLTLVVLVPEAGDEIQHIKSGLMEIGEAFIVNKADRSGSEKFASSLEKIVHQRSKPTPVFKTIADKKEGLDELIEWIKNFQIGHSDKKFHLFAEKAYKLIQNQRMKDVNRRDLQIKLEEAYKLNDFNLYKFIDGYKV